MSLQAAWILGLGTTLATAISSMARCYLQWGALRCLERMQTTGTNVEAAAEIGRVLDSLHGKRPTAGRSA
jgi:hypothetical protein